MLLDIFSRLVVGWLLAERESAELATRLIGESYAKQGIAPGEVTLHADRGTAMTAKTVAQKLADLGISESHSRPRVSTDNPFSESQFKTLKYRAELPDRFDGYRHAERWRSVRNRSDTCTRKATGGAAESSAARQWRRPRAPGR